VDFEWDVDKAASNLTKHGVSFDEATSAFADEYAQIIDDPDSSLEEQRAILMGNSTRGRLLIVVYTLRSNTIRLISAQMQL